MYKLKYKELIHLTKGKHHDGGGLYIRITKQGKGLWTYRFRINKKSHEMSLGTFPEVKISEAREKLAEQKRLRLKDINPLHEKRKHEILKEQQNKKFSEIADLYITTKKKDEWTNPKSEQQWRSTIETYAKPVLDRKPFIDINNDDIVEVLLPIWTTKTETARRLQQRLFRIITFAKVKKWYLKENPASWQEHLYHILPNPFKIKKVKHHPFLHHEKVNCFYNELCEIDLLSTFALRLLILTVTRTSEVIKSKFEQFDLDKGIWNLPYYNMKARKEHTVPLSDDAIAIIKLMRKKHNHEYVFTNPSTGKHISNGAVVLLRRQPLALQQIRQGHSDGSQQTPRNPTQHTINSPHRRSQGSCRAGHVNRRHRENPAESIRADMEEQSASISVVHQYATRRKKRIC